jgi:hypothetical protein
MYYIIYFPRYCPPPTILLPFDKYDIKSGSILAILYLLHQGYREGRGIDEGFMHLTVSHKSKKLCKIVVSIRISTNNLILDSPQLLRRTI